MIILDTNVLSELMRSSPAPQVVQWVQNHRSAELFTTSITQAEIFYGIELMAGGKRRQALLETAEAMFAEDFVGRVLPFDGDAARSFAAIAARRRASGKPISNSDAQIGAIVHLRGATLATRNLADFEGCGIRLVSPWRE